jgi:hypothetical protein
VIDESDSQFAKHFDLRISTFLGIKIDSSDESENTSDSIRVRCVFGSNVIDESDSQLSKLSIQGFQHSLESRSAEVMNVKMLPIQFVSTMNLIQMKLMKMVSNCKNISNKEFQHSLESKLIEVMKMKILPIQFVSSVNLIQM